MVFFCNFMLVHVFSFYIQVLCYVDFVFYIHLGILFYCFSWSEAYKIRNWSGITYGWVIVFGFLGNSDFWIFGVLPHLSLHNVCCTGQLLLAKGEVEQASSAFKIVLEADRDNVPALLGQVY